VRELSVDSKDYGSIFFVGDEIHKGKDLIVQSNNSRLDPDYLFFFDSRGAGQSTTCSLSKMFVHYAEDTSYVLVCRPLHMTIWATLINFFKHNKLNPKIIITNMGFVDFTPKKKDLLLDSIKQVDYAIGYGNAKSHFTEQYQLSNGDKTDLHSVVYSDKYKAAIELLANQYKIVVLNTPPVERKINIERDRPSSFFDGIEEANNFNNAILGVDIVNPPLFDETLTYDAVHYTDEGNKIIFNLLREHL